jgi:molybdenum cofactor cytidylyltransferase
MNVDIEAGNSVAGLVLAAGVAERFGAPKQLAIWQGKTLLERAIENALAVCDAGVVVVTGAHADEVERSLLPFRDQALKIVNNRNWSTGMGGSISAGMHAVADGQGDAVLLMVCDQPCVTVADLEALLGLWQQTPSQPAVAGYGGTVGVPAVFPRGDFVALQELRGDTGAKVLLGERKQLSILDQPAAARDIDTQEELRALQNDMEH